uniref:Uncharacterized protein n=1 Tax=Tetranychus urticae TaxID=32264 RepID=T1JXI1_TETUR
MVELPGIAPEGRKAKRGKIKTKIKDVSGNNLNLFKRLRLYFGKHLFLLFQ